MPCMFFCCFENRGLWDDQRTWSASPWQFSEPRDLALHHSPLLTSPVPPPPALPSKPCLPTNNSFASGYSTFPCFQDKAQEKNPLAEGIMVLLFVELTARMLPWKTPDFGSPFWCLELLANVYRSFILSASQISPLLPKSQLA